MPRVVIELASLLAFDRCSGGGTDIDDALLSGGLALADEGSFRLIVSRDVSHMLHLLRAGLGHSRPGRGGDESFLCPLCPESGSH